MKDVKVAISHFQALPPAITKSIVIAPTGTQASGRTQDDFEAKDAGFLLGAECYEFDPSALKVVPEWPLVYWWDSDLLSRYAFAPKIGDLFDVRQGLCTGNNIRTLRLPWEVVPAMVIKEGVPADLIRSTGWLPFIKGGEGRQWWEPLSWLLNWRRSGLEIRVGAEANTLAARLRILPITCGKG